MFSCKALKSDSGTEWDGRVRDGPSEEKMGVLGVWGGGCGGEVFWAREKPVQRPWGRSDVSGVWNTKAGQCGLRVGDKGESGR